MRANPSRRNLLRFAAVAVAARPVKVLPAEPATIEKKYSPGISDSEIKIGQTMPYSGPLSQYGTIGRAELAYFKMINDQGGINGRRITLISRDDGYNPAKTVEQVRQLIEQEQVAFIFQSLGDSNNAAIQRYLNDRHIPHLFLAETSSRWNDPGHFPWTMPFGFSFRTEGRVYAKYILSEKPNAKIGVLIQNSTWGKDYLAGLQEGLADKAKTMIVKVLTYEATDPTIDSQIVSLQDSGADTFFDITPPKFAVQAIRKAYDTNWRPLHLLTVASAFLPTLESAGFDKSKGIVSATGGKDASDPHWRDDPAVKEWRAWMERYYPEGDQRDVLNGYAYLAGQALVQVLKQCGNDLSRENIMRQAANLHDLELPMLLPGVRINTSPTDYSPLKQMQLMRFDGRNWELFGELISG